MGKLLSFTNPIRVNKPFVGCFSQFQLPSKQWGRCLQVTQKTVWRRLCCFGEISPSSLSSKAQSSSPNNFEMRIILQKAASGWLELKLNKHIFGYVGSHWVNSKKMATCAKFHYLPSGLFGSLKDFLELLAPKIASKLCLHQCVVFEARIIEVQSQPS